MAKGELLGCRKPNLRCSTSVIKMTAILMPFHPPLPPLSQVAKVVNNCHFLKMLCSWLGLERKAYVLASECLTNWEITKVCGGRRHSKRGQIECCSSYCLVKIQNREGRKVNALLQQVIFTASFFWNKRPKQKHKTTASRSNELPLYCSQEECAHLRRTISLTKGEKKRWPKAVVPQNQLTTPVACSMQNTETGHVEKVHAQSLHKDSPPKR